MIILAIGAHPDDIEIGCGGSLYLYSQTGHITYFLVLTKGEVSGIPELREKETLKSAEVLGVRKVFFLDLEDTKIKWDITTISPIEKIITNIHPDMMFIPSFKENHQDHWNTAHSSISAGRNVAKILFYESPTTHNSFSPQIFFDITNSIEKKIEALSYHQSQINKHYLKPEVIKCIARYRAIHNKLQYAEAFEIYRFVENIHP